ncbi:MAG: hypothetical protein Q9224_000964 [Gallowayella concinna]
MAFISSAETRRRLQEHDTKWHVKAILQAICTFLAFIALILFAHVTVLHNDPFDRFGVHWPDWLPLFPILISLTYNPLSFFILLHHHGKSPAPGWNVGVHLLICTLGIPFIFFSIFYTLHWVHALISYDPYGYDDYISDARIASLRTAIKIGVAANVFLLLLT